jgi:subtilisin family serine protease
MAKNHLLWLFILILLNQAVRAQPSLPPINWQLLDWKTDGYPGMSVEKAYTQLLKGKKPQKKIIVAVIDDGLDDGHPDLAGKEWTNAREIPGNGIDDDHNGYVDDVHGWNFIGTTRQETFEEVREYVRLRADSAKVDKRYWTMIVRKKQEKLDNLNQAGQGTATVINAFKTLQTYWQKRLGQDSIYFLQVRKFRPDVSADSTVKAASDLILSFADEVASTPDSVTMQAVIWQIGDYLGNVRQALSAAQEVITTGDAAYFRREAIHDDPYKTGQRGYGNAITFPDDTHGTECAGIIAAQRIDPQTSMGIADAAEIMPLRINSMGHDCDEWDKDVANAIRYAVDNGARVISMSFGKYISPQQAWVTAAIRYAEQKGVLLIHAAGNDGMDVDTLQFYPNAFGDEAHPATNFLTVGASTYDSMLVGGFSNYGKRKVDVFAPGVSIYMTKIHAQHERGFGTSFACPMVAGLSAMIWSYYPQLTLRQVRECIERSAEPIDSMVTVPGTNNKAPFSSLSKTGGIVNAYLAIQYAQRLAH